MQTAPAATSIQYPADASEALQDTNVLGSDLLGCIMPLWRAGTTLTCTLTSVQTDAICQLSDLSPQQLAIFTQVCCLLVPHALLELSVVA